MAPILTEISSYLLLQSWQIAVVFLLVAIACRLLRHASAHWRYLLWLVVLAKCLVPPLLTVPVAILPDAMSASIARAIAPANEPPAPAPQGSPAPPPLLADASVPPRDLPTTPLQHDPQETATLPLPPAPATTDAAPRPAAPVAHVQLALAPRQYLAIGWAAGTMLLLALAAIRAAGIHRHVRQKRCPATDDLVDESAELTRQLGLPCPPRLWLIRGIAQPFVWGMLRGSVYLPAGFRKAGSAQHRRGILMHELAHVARHDAAVNLLQVLVQAVFFFHPLVWWANHRIRQEREKCCDEVAIAHLGAPPRQYGEAIVSSLVHEYESTGAVPSLAVAGPVRNIEERIKTIMRPNRRFYRRPSRLAVVSVLLLAILSIPTALVLTAREAARGTSEPQAASLPLTPAALQEMTIQPGRGLDIIQLDDPIEKIEQLFGKPDHRAESQAEGIWISYRPSLGIDFWLPLQTKRIREIRFNLGFAGRTPDGIHIGSTVQQVLDASGGARKTIDTTVSGMRAGHEDRVLYRARPWGILSISGYKFFDTGRGMLYWFDQDGKATQIVAFQPDPSAQPNAPTQPAATQPEEPSAWRNLPPEGKAYPAQSPEQLFEALRADMLDNKWNYQSGDLYSFTLRNPAPNREAARTIEKQVPVSPEQTTLLVDASICFVDVAGHDSDTVDVQATVFVRSKTSADAAEAFTKSIDVELAVDGPNVRLGDHYGVFRSQDIESAGVIYTVKVPRRLAVDVRIPNGRLTVQDITGGLTFIGGGNVIASAVRGRTIIRTGNGKVLLYDLPGPDHIALDVGNGSVTLIGLAAPLDLNLRNGGVCLDARKAAPPTVKAIVTHGSIDVVGIVRQEHLANATFSAAGGVTTYAAGGSQLQARTLHVSSHSDVQGWKMEVLNGTIGLWPVPDASDKFSQPSGHQPEHISADRIDLDFGTGKVAASGSNPGEARPETGEPQPAAQPKTSDRVPDERLRLLEELARTSRALAAKHKEITDFYGDEAAVPDILNQSTALTDNLMRLGVMRTEAKARMEALKAQYETWQKAGLDKIPLSEPMISTIETNPEIANLEKRRADLVEQRQSLVERFGEQHREVRDLDSRIATLNQQAKARRLEKANQFKQAQMDRLRLDMLAAVDQVNRIDQEYREAQAAQTDMDRRRAHLDKLLDEKKRIEEQLDRARQALQDLERQPGPYRDPTLQPGDVVDISIYELLQEQTESVFRRQISEAGDTPLPVLGRVKLAGLTTRQAEDMLKARLTPDMLRSTSVHITIVSRYGLPAGPPDTPTAGLRQNVRSLLEQLRGRHDDGTFRQFTDALTRQVADVLRDAEHRGNASLQNLDEMQQELQESLQQTTDQKTRKLLEPILQLLDTARDKVAHLRPDMNESAATQRVQ